MLNAHCCAAALISSGCVPAKYYAAIQRDADMLKVYQIHKTARRWEHYCIKKHPPELVRVGVSFLSSRFWSRRFFWTLSRMRLSRVPAAEPSILPVAHRGDVPDCGTGLKFQMSFRLPGRKAFHSGPTARRFGGVHEGHCLSVLSFV